MPEGSPETTPNLTPDALPSQGYAAEITPSVPLETAMETPPESPVSQLPPAELFTDTPSEDTSHPEYVATPITEAGPGNLSAAMSTMIGINPDAAADFAAANNEVAGQRDLYGPGTDRGAAAQATADQIATANPGLGNAEKAADLERQAKAIDAAQGPGTDVADALRRQVAALNVAPISQPEVTSGSILPTPEQSAAGAQLPHDSIDGKIQDALQKTLNTPPAGENPAIKRVLEGEATDTESLQAAVDHAARLSDELSLAVESIKKASGFNEGTRAMLESQPVIDAAINQSIAGAQANREINLT